MLHHLVWFCRPQWQISTLSSHTPYHLMRPVPFTPRWSPINETQLSVELLKVKYAPESYLKSILLQEHIANMLMEQCAFQIWSWSIFDLENSFRLLMVQDHMDHKLRPKSPKSVEIWYLCTLDMCTRLLSMPVPCGVVVLMSIKLNKLKDPKKACCIILDSTYTSYTDALTLHKRGI